MTYRTAAGWRYDVHKIDMHDIGESSDLFWQQTGAGVSFVYIERRPASFYNDRRQSSDLTSDQTGKRTHAKERMLSRINQRLLVTGVT